MRVHVQLEGVAMATGVAAFRALERLLVGMDSFVTVQVRLIWEGFAAFVASERSCAQVKKV